MAPNTLLAPVPLFAGLNPTELEDLAALLHARRYRKGEAIFHEGDAGGSLLIVQEGTVKLSLSSDDGREVILDFLGPSDFFGELALLDGDPRSADAVAVTACSLHSLGRADFLQFVFSRPEATSSLLATLSHRLRRADEQLHDVAFLDVPSRLARALLKLAADSAAVGESASRPHRLTQGQLASLVGTTRESVNKWLAFYERNGLVRWGDGVVTVLKPRDLQRYAS